ncbi:hypothetical protein DN752_17720 [Echinicola strongylocentroti]|uniref:Uncharacterized protein n=1 Tax=Echinicola strongylocentroti TaxID=1795355 RepID=A0A2Z4IM76_9BACT|nr:hypothetical protein [Echinicola strongylocentroti]AWW31820.1 hypothetical protein DN752_17720 [Echinicola strongylocentroti]
MPLDQFYKLIENSTEIWDSGIGFLVMIFTGIQTFIVVVAFKEGRKYLHQHREKIKEERRLEVIYNTMKFTKNYISWLMILYRIPISIKEKMVKGSLTESKAALKIIEEYISKRNQYYEKNELHTDIDLNVKILGEKNISRVWNNLSEAVSAIDHKFEDLGNPDHGLDPDKIRKKVMAIPNGMLDQNYDESRQALSSYKKLMDLLLIEYRKKITPKELL